MVAPGNPQTADARQSFFRLRPWYTRAMNTHTTQHALIVALTDEATMSTGYGETTGRIQVFPVGSFAARDGRPGNITGVTVTAWRLTADDAQALVNRWFRRKTRTVVDYEHQTHLSDKNGQPAPAAGWIEGLEITAEGLFATVEWTDRARAAIRAKEYQYISPVFAWDKTTGAVLDLVSVALTNHPALDGMQPAQAKTIEEGNPHMEKLLAMLRKLLGLPETADDAACTAALATLPQENLIALLKSKDDALTAAQNAIATTKATPPDASQYVSMATFQSVQTEAAQLRAKVAELEGAQSVAALSADIDAALKDGRLAVSAKDWALGMAKSNPDSLRAFLKAATPIEALKGQQSAASGQPGDDGGLASLTAEDKYVCAQLGMTEADYLKAKEAK